MSQPDLLVQANQAIEQGDLSAASNLCAQLLQEDETNRAGSLLLARICLNLGKDDGARIALSSLGNEALQSFLVEFDEHEPKIPGECHLAAFIAEYLGDTQRAIGLSRRAVELHPKRIDERVLLAKLLRTSGDLDAAFEELMTLADINVTHTAVQREAARWFTAAGKYDEALAQYRQILSIYPGERQSRAERWALKQRLEKTAPYCSEAGQDEYLHQTFFREANEGSFVNIGASAETRPSNTAFFALELGWRGISAEAPSSDELTLLLESNQLLAPSYLSCTSYDGSGLLEDLNLRRYRVGVFSIRKPSETLKQRLKQHCYTLDITVADDEIWYHPQLVNKLKRR